MENHTDSVDCATRKRPKSCALPAAKALLVLGMHRSGTSALARVLSLRGAAISRDVIGPDPSNPRGYWEPTELPSLHEELFGFLGSCGSDFQHVDLSRLNSDAVRRFEEQLLRFLEREFATAPLFVAKDPRMCRFAPLWLRATRRFGAEPKAVIPIRNPLEVVASLLRRGAEKPLHQHLLWLRYVLDAEFHTRNVDRVFVAYQDLLGDWMASTDRIAQTLKIKWPRSIEDSASEIDAFLDHALHHHQVSEVDVQRSGDTHVWVKKIFKALASVATGKTADDAAFRDELDSIRSDFDRIRVDADQVNRIGGIVWQHYDTIRGNMAQSVPKTMERIAELERALAKSELEYALISQAYAKALQRLRKIRTSLSWKLTKPVRFVGRRFRSQRQD